MLAVFSSSVFRPIQVKQFQVLNLKVFDIRLVFDPIQLKQFKDFKQYFILLNVFGNILLFFSTF